MIFGLQDKVVAILPAAQGLSSAPRNLVFVILTANSSARWGSEREKEKGEKEGREGKAERVLAKPLTEYTKIVLVHASELILAQSAKRVCVRLEGEHAAALVCG